MFEQGGSSLIRCYITDRKTLAPGEAVLSVVAHALLRAASPLMATPDRGVEKSLDTARMGACATPPLHPDWIQLREKDLSARDLFDLTRSVLALPNPSGVKILVNSRIDVALAAGASGAHLPSGSPPPRAWRAIAPPGFLLGVSCHSPEEVRQAADEGADYAIFGPVFRPLSKPAQSPPLGLEGLARAASAARIPVLALGGITRETIPACIEAGAAGVAGISLFQTKA